jgi:hypothetical protein
MQDEPEKTLLPQGCDVLWLSVPALKAGGRLHPIRHPSVTILPQRPLTAHEISAMIGSRHPARRNACLPRY